MTLLNPVQVQPKAKTNALDIASQNETKIKIYI